MSDHKPIIAIVYRVSIVAITLVLATFLFLLLRD